MRIIGGKFRGTALTNVGKGDEAAHLRPTTDRVRESLFNILEHGDYPSFDGARVLDLFAGTGALGFEALSRGAALVQFVDDGAKAGALIKQNMRLLNAAKDTKLLRRNATRIGDVRGEPFDIIFLDPPYGKSLGEKALDAAITGGWVAPKALVIWEESADILPPNGFNILDQRKYGDTKISILRAP